jgi:exopolyphosphatase/guanosine-5'-triphosphate,3'-diphosphate pyrophosphatase
MATIASIDVGSNAIRIMIAQVTRNGSLRPLVRRREPIRLGRDVFSTGKISPQLIQASVRAFKRFKILCEQHKVILIRAVGTSALREAMNGAALIKAVQTRTGITIEIISGEEEARLIQVAVSKAIILRRKLAVLVDMGGGSTEVSLLHNCDMIMSETHPIGAVRLLHLLGAKKLSSAQFTRLVREYVSGLQRQLKRHISKRKVHLCIGTGGNFECLGDLRARLLKKQSRDRLTLTDLQTILEHLNSLSLTDRVRKLGLRPDRADVIVPAAAILAEIMRAAEVSQVRLPGVGLKEGILIDLLPQVQSKRAQTIRQQQIAFALELGRIYQNDMKHAETVRERAVYLFNRSARIHKLTPDTRVLLEIAALLHDIGHFVNSDEHHKHSMYLIRSTPLLGFDKRAQDIIACVARYHRKAAPKSDHEVYQQLSKADQRIVCKLAALLRIADASDRGRGRVKQLELRNQGNACVVSLRGSGELLLEEWSIRKKADLFESLFKRKVAVKIARSKRS